MEKFYMNIKKLYNNIAFWHDIHEYPENESEIIVTGLHKNIPFAFCKYIKTFNMHVLKVAQVSDLTKELSFSYFSFHKIYKWMYVKDFKDLVD
jgi:hypothetical protein